MAAAVPVAWPDFQGHGEIERIIDVLSSGWLTMGRQVQDFERRFAAEISRTEHAVACVNGTAALELAIRAAGVGEDMRVAIPALTYGGTANAVIHSGAVPVVVDVDPDTWLVNSALVADGDASVCVAVHLYGEPVDVYGLAEQANVIVIEDACEAPGAKVNGRSVGSLGLSAAFSFYANKPIATGEGGMVTTNSAIVYEDAVLFRGQGQHPERRYWHVVPGHNFRMTDLVAAIGLAQLDGFEENQQARRRVVERYENNLHGLCQMRRPRVNIERGYWLAAFLLPGNVDRDRVMRRLEAHGIETRAMFPPLSTMPAYSAFAPWRCPVAEEIATRGIVLPTWPQMTDAQVDMVSDRLLEACRH